MVDQAQKISVVIATLGIGNLEPTLHALLKNTLPPQEIIICVPYEFYFRCEKYTKLATILRTNSKGQVAQRIEGFLASSHDIVVQCDDDLLPEQNCLEKMASCLIDDYCAVGPRFRRSNGKIASGLLPLNDDKLFIEKKLENLVFFLANGTQGFKPGCVSKLGIGFGVGETNEKAVQVEWLPGGMVMHHKKNLILKNYYSYPGKAFSEDILHSRELTKKQIKLILAAQATCIIQDEILPTTQQVKNYLKFLCQSLKMGKQMRFSKVQFFLFWILNQIQIVIRWTRKIYS